MTQTYTFDLTLFSDLHKDAYGFRPKGDYYVWLESCTDDEKQQEWDRLCDALRDTIEHEQQAAARAAEKFDHLVADLMRCGARDFDMAIRWLHEAHDTAGDDDYLEYCLGLSYGHIRAARVCQNVKAAA